MKIGQHPRTYARRSKLRSLTKAQRSALRRWLITESLTYREASGRLQAKFGISLSSGMMSRFWNKQCLPKPPQPKQSPVLLDVILRSARPIRLTILQNNARLLFKTGPLPKRGVDKKPAFIIGPDNASKSK